MTFFPTDLYLSSGLGSIQNSWTDHVTKFDTSTFYNWEQDNTPLYDLDERTSFLWEKAGYPVKDGYSGIPGKIYVVSSNAPFAGESSSVNGIPVFKHVSSVISVLPNPLTYPAIIEIASIGSLGALDISNLKIDPNCAGAGLEIINRCFARSTTLSGTTYNATSSLTSPDMVGTIHGTSCLALSSPILSGFADTGWNNYNRVWMAKAPAGSATHVGTNDLLLSINSNNFDYNSATDLLGLLLYDNTWDPSQSNTEYEIAVTRPIDSVAMNRGSYAVGDAIHSLMYGNHFTEVSIKNCAGPIYIRGFAADGIDGTVSIRGNRETGFDIQNSNVMLENCMAIRFSDYGFKFVNSDVQLSRSIAAGRNYGYIGSTSVRDLTKGVGIYAINSVLRVRGDSYATGSQCIIQAARNVTGIELINSRICEGTEYDGASPTSRTFIQAFQNTNIGINLIISNWDHKGHLDIFNNGTGMKVTQSFIKLPSIVAEYNQNAALELYGSKLEYNPFLVDYNHFSTYGTYEAFHFNSNGQHIVSDDSIISPTYTQGMPSYFGLMHFLDSFGLTEDIGLGSQLPSIELNNGSYLELVHPFCRTLQDNATFKFDRPIFGACVAVTCGSVFKSKGSVNGGSIFMGPAFVNGQIKTSVINANGNSTVELNGPTLICQGGVDVLAENQSTIKILPHNKGEDLDASGWSLDNYKNHTRVELHSTRACLVANNNSTILMEDLGNYYHFWPDRANNDYNDNDSLGIDLYTSGGFVQFYPNGQDSTIVDSLNTDYLPTIGPTTSYAAGYFVTDYTSGSIRSQLSAVSTGGVCVKAADNSLVKVNNVHFPAGWYNTSGYWYDINSVNCDQLRIWNIADGSHLEAAYCSVSATYPSLAGYYGPSGVFTSGSGAIAYGCPNLPDTGTLSVLDQYGKTPSFSGTNYGPFRLYLSPGPQSKILTFEDGIYGPTYQLWAQGYNVSGNVSGAAQFSGIYSGINSLQFVHVSSLLDSSWKDRIRLDESAADMFANARHCASNKSGRNALVTIYRSTTDSGGVGYCDVTTVGKGRGFKSADIFDLRRDN